MHAAHKLCTNCAVFEIFTGDFGRQLAPNATQKTTCYPVEMVLKMTQEGETKPSASASPSSVGSVTKTSWISFWCRQRQSYLNLNICPQYAQLFMIKEVHISVSTKDHIQTKATVTYVTVLYMKFSAVTWIQCITVTLKWQWLLQAGESWWS